MKMWCHKTTFAFALFLLLEPCLGVEPRTPATKDSPTLTAGLAEIKTILSSVQGSLITSVSLIQDQVDQFAKQYTSSLDDRLAKMESRLASMEVDMKDVREKGRAWDTFRDHASSWAELMMSVDSKVDHLSMSQTEQLSSMSGQLSSLQTAMGEGLEKLSERISYLETQARSNKEETHTEVVALLKTIDGRLTEMSTGHLRARPRTGHQMAGKPATAPPCVELKDIVKRSALKVDSIFAILTDDGAKELTSSSDKDYNNEDSDGEDFGTIDEETEHHLVKLFRRISQPFKKASKNVSKKFDRAVTDVTFLMRDAVTDIDRKFNDFFNMTMEMFEHQHHQLESYETSLNGLRQCCSGTTSDLSDFKARSLSSFERLDIYLARNMQQDQSTERCRQQIRFDADRIMAAVKDQEKLLTDGLDQCGRGFSGFKNETLVETESSATTTEATNTTTTTLMPTTTTAPQTTTPEVHEEASKLIMRTCEDLMNAGFLESKVYTLDVGETGNNENGRDFRRRFCDQETSGGGWTVIQRRGDYGEPRTNFTTTWTDYKSGFGDLYGEFWFGNDFIHKITNKANPVVLRVELEDFDNVTVIAEYSTFRIENESDNYRLWVGGYTGNATDSLSAHNGYPFSTVDKNNDEAPKCCPCAPAYGGGWWFYSCFESNLNGEYHIDPTDNDYYRGIIWELWRGDYSLASSKMMIRSKAYHDTVNNRGVNSTTPYPDP